MRSSKGNWQGKFDLYGYKREMEKIDGWVNVEKKEGE
jgi:hypothetical protein